MAGRDISTSTAKQSPKAYYIGSLELSESAIDWSISLWTLINILKPQSSNWIVIVVVYL